jgi:pyrimidine operon attenuation protein/uracil phosphoribosyltransferase
MEILDQQSIIQKIKRLGIQILEHQIDSPGIYFLGINNNGYNFAKLLQEELENHQPGWAKLQRVQLNPAKPIEYPIQLDIPVEELQGKHIILVDDVANTGRTLYYALQPLMSILPSSVEVAVLVDRTHKSFPIRVDYVGLSLATTLKEHIKVNLKSSPMSVQLN